MTAVDLLQAVATIYGSFLVSGIAVLGALAFAIRLARQGTA